MEKFWKEAKKIGTLGIIAFMAACKGPDAPSQQTIREYFAKTPTAERVDATKAKEWSNTLGEWNKIKSQDPNIGKIDLRTSAEKAMGDRVEGFLNIREASLENDSTIMVTEYKPYAEKHDKEIEAAGNSAGLRSHDFRYIFHKNGQIEMGMGNRVQDVGSEHILASAGIDAETGGITWYKVEDPVEDNSFRLTKEGTMEIGRDYQKNEAQDRLQKTIVDDMDAIRATLEQGK